MLSDHISKLLNGQMYHEISATQHFPDVKSSKFAYHILKVHRLLRPISASELLDFTTLLPHHWWPTSPSFILCFGPLVQ
jgi:hypothetical protein